MKIYKCYDSYGIYDKDQVLAVWAENEVDALNKCVEIHKTIDFYEDPVNTVLDNWIAEQYTIAKDVDVFICYPQDITHYQDVYLISVPFEIQDVQEYIINQLVEIESQEDYFREYINDIGVNMSFNERFYDEDGYVFKPTLPIRVRDDIKQKAKAVEKSVMDFVEEDIWLDNVSEFFRDNAEFRNQYLEYVYSGEEPFFEDEFYFYVCKKLMQNGEWTEFDIKKVDIFA